MSIVYDLPAIRAFKARQLRWAHALLWVTQQYAESRYVTRNADGQMVAFIHQCMSAGELATDLLVEAGLGRDQGWKFELNQEAIDLMDKDELDIEPVTITLGNWLIATSDPEVKKRLEQHDFSLAEGEVGQDEPNGGDMKTFREIVDEVMRRNHAGRLMQEVMADCFQALADEMDRRYPPQPIGGGDLSEEQHNSLGRPPFGSITVR